MQKTIDFLTNREWAIVIWGLILLIYVCRTKSVRISIANVIRAFFAKKIMLTFLVTAFLILLFCLVLSCFDIWNISMLKDTIIYSAWSIIAIMHIIDEKNPVPFKDIVTKQIEVNAVLLAIVNFYTFSMYCEMIFVPIVYCIIKLADYSKGKDEIVYKFLKATLNIIWLSLLGICIYKVIEKPSSLFSRKFIDGMMLPIIMTLLLLPYYYLLSIYSLYEQCFIILKCMSRGNMEEYRFRRNALIKACGINIKKLKHVKSDWRPALCDTNDEFLKELKAVCNYKRINYYDQY